MWCSTTLLLVLTAWSSTASASLINTKVVNGTDAMPGEFPYMVSLRTVPTGSHFCGGTLISDKWIMTAAHCVVGKQPYQVNVQYGSQTLDPNSKNVSKISQIIVHEQYNASNLYKNDIALVKLFAPVYLGEHFTGVCMPTNNNTCIATGTHVTLAGWGLNATGGVGQKQLQKVNLQSFSDEDCSRLHRRPIHYTNICAGVPEGGKGQCNGDSGGPLICGDCQIGIVSWSVKPCTIAPYPGVYTEVSHYIYWIQTKIFEPDNYTPFTNQFRYPKSVRKLY